MTRDPTIDIAKGIGIILVVVGHTIAAQEAGHDTLHRFIYSFHMPLFLGIGGLYIAYSKSISQVFLEKFRRILVPFVFWVLIYFIFEHVKNYLKAVINGTTHALPLISLNDLVSLARAVLFANWNALLDAGVFVDLWFLPSLFIMILILRIIRPYIVNVKLYILLPSAAALAYWLIRFSSASGIRPLAIWNTDVALSSCFFVFLLQTRHMFYKLHAVFIPLLLVFMWYLSKDADIAVATLSISNPLKYFAAASGGIAVTLLLARRLENTSVGTILSRFGQRSYAIYVMSGIVGYFSGAITRLVPMNAPLVSETFKCMLILTVTYFLYPLIVSNHYVAVLGFGVKPIRKSDLGRQ